MNSPIKALSGFKPVACKLTMASLLVLSLGACKTLEEPGAHVAGHTLVDASQRHPIMVSQQPASLSMRVAKGSHGLTPSQRGQVTEFLRHYRSVDAGNSKLIVAVPSGSPNESSAMNAVGELRGLISEYGFSESAVAIEPYNGGRDAGAPIRVSYLRYVAEGPECGRWPTNLAEDKRNLNYPNFGCAQQKNLAAQVANPADLLGPRTMEPSDATRRNAAFAKYRKGESTVSEKAGDEKVQVKGAQ